jgi:putative membrane protein
MRLLVKWAIVAVALLVATYIVPGIYVDDSNAWLAVFVTAAILSVLNMVLKPILTFLSCGLIVATLGLFMFVINGVVLLLASRIAVTWFHVGFRVDGIIPAILGSIVVSIVSLILNGLVADEQRR